MIETANDAVKLLWEYDIDALTDLNSGMENYPNVDPDWVWILKRDGEVVASLFAAPVHGVIFLMRLNAKPSAPPTAIRELMRVAFQCIKGRGYTMFFTFFDATR